VQLSTEIVTGRNVSFREDSSLFGREFRRILTRTDGVDEPNDSTCGQIPVLDLFSGCGGLSYGFHFIEQSLRTFKLIEAIDTDIHANATYRANFGLKPKQLDLLSIPPIEVAEMIRKDSDVDAPIVIGGPPCVAFSSHKKKDKRQDERSSLVVRFAETAVELNARLIIMENVPDLLGKRHWRHFQEFWSVLADHGYHISYEIFNMASFGVPQSRHRLICIASRNFIPSLPIGMLKEGSFNTVRDAIGDLPQLQAGEQSASDPLHVTSRHRKATVELIKQVPLDGGSRPKGVGPECLDRVHGFFDVYGRLHWDRPSITLTARCRTPSCGRYVHPEQHRGLSVREASLLQGFPPDFKFEGPFDDKFKQIGNSVPPLFSLALALHVRGLVDGFIPPLTSKQQIPGKPPFGSYSGSIAAKKRRRNIRRRDYMP